MSDDNRRKREEEKRKFAGDKVPSMKRRSETHDYHSKRFYMITLVVNGRCPLLGRLAGDAEAPEGSANAPHIVLTPLGQAIADEWAGISTIYEEVAVIACRVMPDHLHGILYVREKTDFHLGQVIKGFKIGCNRLLRAALETQRTREGAERAALETQRTREGAVRAALETQRTREGAVGAALETQRTREGAVERERAGASEDGEYANLLRSYAANSSQPIGRETLWEPKYNDKILHNYSTLEKWKGYLYDNPRRLAIRRAYPDLFRVRFGITVAAQSYAAIGNVFLLNYPDKLQVQLSRSLTDEEVKQQVEHFLSLARKGTVIVSPAISKGEQAVMRAVLDAGLPQIFLTPWGFNTFSKPGHQYYEACAEGRFLMMAPWEHQNERVPLTRSMCLALNQMAQQICCCALTADTMNAQQ